MTRIERRQYEMLLRIRDFASTHRELFSGLPAAHEAFDSVDAAVSELTAAALLKLSASVQGRADRKAIARKALVDVLTRVGQLARVLRARGQTLPAFELPLSRTDQGLLTVARQFARDAAALEAEFSGHGMAPKVIADVAAAFEATIRDRDIKRADHTLARTRIHDRLTSAILEVRRLDLIVDNALRRDNVIRAVWKQARRVGDPRRTRGGGEAVPPVAAVNVAPAAIAPAASTPGNVIPMPSTAA